MITIKNQFHDHIKHFDTRNVSRTRILLAMQCEDTEKCVIHEFANFIAHGTKFLDTVKPTVQNLIPSLY